MQNSEKNDSLFMESIKQNKWAIILILLQLVAVIISLVINPYFFIFLLALFIISDVVVYQYFMRIKDNLNEYIRTLSSRIKKSEEESLIKMPIGIILYENNIIEWVNPYGLSIIPDSDVIGKKIDEILPELSDIMKGDKEKKESNIEIGGKHFRALRQPDLQVIYMLDVTQTVKIEKNYEQTRPVIGYLLLDNYDELSRELDDREVSKLDNYLTTYFSNWFRQRDIYYRKLSNSRYLLLMNKLELDNLEEDKFTIIDNIRERTSKRSVPLTASIGLSYGDENFDDIAETAENNLELALGRGGDQAIVSEHGKNPRYYGGKSNPITKRTRVRARVITQALEKLMIQSDSIFVMGHKSPDLDAIGSSLGVRRIAEMNGLEAKVVIDQNNLNKDVKLLIDASKANDTIWNSIVSPEEAYEQADDNSLIIMVDHNKQSLSIASDLLEKSNRLVIIDHHRRGTEFPGNPSLVYIEPYASSASELITEMFEFVTGDGAPINKIEATALLGGIVVDSNNFSLRTGSRTYNAASFLQSVGADNVMIRDILSEDANTYMKRSHLIGQMEKVDHNIAVSAGEENVTYNSVLAAQAADTMLSFSNVEASFVIYMRDDDKVGISARSVGGINVQRIMEEMGGGGHLTNAATQIEDKTIAEVREQLIKVIDELVEDE